MDNVVFLVFDRSKGFSRFLKKNYSDFFEIHLWKGNKDNFDIKNKFPIAFIQINSLDDLTECITLVNQASYVFWSTSIKDIKNSLLNVNNFIFLDMELNKKEVIEKIDINIKLLTFDY